MFVPLVKHIVYKKLRELPASCEVEDLISCGIESLIAALDRYDPAKGAGLEPYLNSHPRLGADELAAALGPPFAAPARARDQAGSRELHRRARVPALVRRARAMLSMARPSCARRSRRAPTPTSRRSPRWW